MDFYEAVDTVVDLLRRRSGKSRLLYEFRQRFQDTQATYLEGRCLSYESTIPYHPIIDVHRTNCAITETDSPEAITQKIRLSLEEVGMDAAESTLYLLSNYRLFR